MVGGVQFPSPVLMSKKDIRRRDVRVWQNAVTGKIESLVLDNVQLHAERLTGMIENALMALGTADRDRLIVKVQEWLKVMKMPEGGIVRAINGYTNGEGI